jgi:hypothetical protein
MEARHFPPPPSSFVAFFVPLSQSLYSRTLTIITPLDYWSYSSLPQIWDSSSISPRHPRERLPPPPFPYLGGCESLE